MIRVKHFAKDMAIRSRCSCGRNCPLTAVTPGISSPFRGARVTEAGSGRPVLEEILKVLSCRHISSGVETFRFSLPNVTRSSMSPPSCPRALWGVASVSRADRAGAFLTHSLTPPLPHPLTLSVRQLSVLHPECSAFYSIEFMEATLGNKMA